MGTGGVPLRRAGYLETAIKTFHILGSKCHQWPAWTPVDLAKGAEAHPSDFQLAEPVIPLAARARSVLIQVRSEVPGN